jgi:hypothetical protein
MAKRRRRQPELVGGFGEGQHPLLLGGRQVLRRVVGNPGRFELGVGSTHAARRLRPGKRLVREAALLAGGLATSNPANSESCPLTVPSRATLGL